MHGYLSSGDGFIYQKSFFERFFTCYYPDLKGFGKNTDMPFPYSLSDYCREVKEYMINNGIMGASVIAHSFGGRIAVKMASEDPNVFNKIVLTGAAGLKPKRSIKYRLKKVCFNFLKHFIKREKLSKFYSKDYNALTPVMKESFKLIVNEHLDDRLSFIRNETLIINGTRDKETPPYTAKRFKKNIINSKLIFIKGAGHFAFIDEYKKFNEQVKEFLIK